MMPWSDVGQRWMQTFWSALLSGGRLLVTAPRLSLFSQASATPVQPPPAPQPHLPSAQSSGVPQPRRNPHPHSTQSLPQNLRRHRLGRAQHQLGSLLQRKPRGLRRPPSPRCAAPLHPEYAPNTFPGADLSKRSDLLQPCNSFSAAMSCWMGFAGGACSCGRLSGGGAGDGRSGQHARGRGGRLDRPPGSASCSAGA